MNQNPCPIILFEQPDFITSNEIHNVVTYKWLHQGKKAFAKFSITDGIGISLPKTPYSGLCIEGKLSISETTLLVAHLIEFGRQHNLKKLILKQRPIIFDTNPSKLNNPLTQLGFTSTSEINHHVELNATKVIPIHNMQQRKIKKCLNNGFRFKKEPRENVYEIYHFIQNSREERGLTINIPFDRLDKIMAQYTYQYQMFSIRSKEGKLAACTIVVLVSDKVIYNYLPAFNRDFSVFSPLALLHYKLYEHFTSMNFSHIDLGISSIHGVPQESLISFKEKMGGIQSSRLIYQFNY